MTSCASQRLAILKHGAEHRRSRASAPSFEYPHTRRMARLQTMTVKCCLECCGSVIEETLVGRSARAVPATTQGGVFHSSESESQRARPISGSTSSLLDNDLRQRDGYVPFRWL
jgi:hypothetical protein